MSKHPVRVAMQAALRDVVVPELRSRGFKGSFPHFRRPSDTRIDLLTFQFAPYGGSFVVEAAQCGPLGLTRPGGSILPQKVTAWDVGKRLRLGSQQSGGGDHWFVYGKPSFDEGPSKVEAPAHYRAIAEEVRRLLDVEAEPYWTSAAARQPAAADRAPRGR